MSVVSAISRFRACEGSLELFAREGKGAQDLLQSNPLAGFCLAVNEHFRPPPAVYPVAAAWALAYRPQREILAWLGFPTSEAVAKIGRKCVPESLDLARCRQLRRALADESIRKMLAHVPRINAGVIGLVTRRDLHRQLTPQLLAEVSQRQTEDTTDVQARTLEDNRRMARVVRPAEQPRPMLSVRRLTELHEEMMRELNRQQAVIRRAGEFPPPPLPEYKTANTAITPILTVEALAALGREQHNCVASYAEDVTRKRLFIYRVVVRKEVATLSVKPGAQDRWEFDQLKTACNGAASSATYRVVQHWLFTTQAPVESAGTEPGSANAIQTFLPVPVAGIIAGELRIEPVTSLAMLQAVADDWLPYQPEIERNRAYVYRVTTGTGMCAVMIGRERRGGWQLRAVCAPGGAPVRGEMLTAIAGWLGRSQKLFR